MTRRRIIVFGLVGSSVAVFQLAIMSLLLTFLPFEEVVKENLANVISFVLSLQLNYLLSSKFTWKDRQSNVKSWMKFNMMMTGTLFLNQIAFSLSNMILPAIVASMVGIGTAATVNYFLSSRVIFRENSPKMNTTQEDMLSS